MIGLLESTGNFLMGACMDPRIPPDVKIAFRSRAAALHAEAETSLPKVEALYDKVHSLSKSLESSGIIDQAVDTEAYATVLEVMNFLQAAQAGDW